MYRKCWDFGESSDDKATQVCVRVNSTPTAHMKKRDISGHTRNLSSGKAETLPSQLALQA